MRLPAARSLSLRSTPVSFAVTVTGPDPGPGCHLTRRPAASSSNNKSIYSPSLSEGTKQVLPTPQRAPAPCMSLSVRHWQAPGLAVMSVIIKDDRILISSFAIPEDYDTPPQQCKNSTNFTGMPPIRRSQRPTGPSATDLHGASDSDSESLSVLLAP